MGAQLIQNRISQRKCGTDMVVRGVVATELNSLKNLGLSLFSKTGQFRETVLFAGLFQRLDRVDAQFFMDCLDLLRAKPGDVQHRDQPLRDRCLEVVVIRQLPGGGQFRDLLGQRAADALYLAQAFLLDQHFQRLGQPLQRACPILVGASLERVFPLQLKEYPNLLENVRNFVLLHPAIKSPTPTLGQAELHTAWSPRSVHSGLIANF